MTKKPEIGIGDESATVRMQRSCNGSEHDDVAADRKISSHEVV